ncbi:MAG: hypothetical protein PUP91_09540, partial [Rhizonema sp. PD37]|nr:hypothetical protein [Rhizonema sp. PD37]
MHQEQKDFCFCTLALGKKYRIFSQQLAEDLAERFPGVFLVIYTDEPKDFHNNSNVLAYKHNQQGVLFCYHDKRFPLAKALSKFRVAIFVDADMRIVNEISGEVYFPPGITAGHQENLIEHIEKYT